MTFVESCDRTFIFQGRGGHNEIVEADHLAGRFQARPNAGMFKRCDLSVGKNPDQTQNSVDVLFPLALYARVARSTPCHNSATVMAATWNCSLGCDATHCFKSKPPFSPRMITSASRTIATGSPEP